MTFINAMNINFFFAKGGPLPYTVREGAGRPNIIFNAAFPSLPAGTLQHFGEPAGTGWTGPFNITQNSHFRAAAAANFGNLS